MVPAGIEPATFQFVAQHLNHCATAVPIILVALVTKCPLLQIQAFYTNIPDLLLNV